MTDLERAREALLKLSPIQAVMALVEASRREGAEAEKVNITALAEEAYSHGAEEMRERAAQTARIACLVPPDGGSPTEEERLVCEEAERRIRALPLTPEEPIKKAPEGASHMKT